jgi:hypothetical protein
MMILKTTTRGVQVILLFAALLLGTGQHASAASILLYDNNTTNSNVQTALNNWGSPTPSPT